ncbi:MAG: hypothetical protein K0S07_118 [Chlamydiales bacterium]|jgi:hypothetical protein|nr:hypothetical protein [Chlamydiales bacterium]
MVHISKLLTAALEIEHLPRLNACKCRIKDLEGFLSTSKKVNFSLSSFLQTKASCCQHLALKESKHAQKLFNFSIKPNPHLSKRLELKKSKVGFDVLIISAAKVRGQGKDFLSPSKRLLLNRLIKI